MTTKYPWTDSASWPNDSGTDELIDDDVAYGVCPHHGPHSVFRLSPYWRHESCGSYPDGPVSRPTT
jgi:hypothetical protein